MQEITATELKARIDAGDKLSIIDVRQPDEHAFARIEGSKLIPLGQLLGRAAELDPTQDAVIYCKTGGRSGRAILALQQAGYAGPLFNLTGGVTAWSNEVDPRVPKY